MKKGDKLLLAKKPKIKKLPELKNNNFFGKILAVISILGFTSIITMTFFNYSIESYLESALLMLMGIGFMYQSEPRELIRSLPNHFQEQSFASITTFVIGSLAIIVGILSLPQINLQNPTLSAINGIIAIIAIIFIVIETWIIQ